MLECGWVRLNPERHITTNQDNIKLLDTKNNEVRHDRVLTRKNLKGHAEEHLDGDIEMRVSKAEGFAGDAADVSHEQMQAEERHLEVWCQARWKCLTDWNNQSKDAVELKISMVTSSWNGACSRKW